MRPFVLAPREGTRVRNPVGGDLVLELEGSHCEHATTVLETEAAHGEGPPLHYHRTQDEWLYVPDGTFRFRIDDEVLPAPRGTRSPSPIRAAIGAATTRSTSRDTAGLRGRRATRGGA